MEGNTQRLHNFEYCFDGVDTGSIWGLLPWGETPKTNLNIAKVSQFRAIFEHVRKRPDNPVVSDQPQPNHARVTRSCSDFS